MNVTELRQLIATELAEVHTCLPGVIVSYDGACAVVRPALPKQLANGTALAPPQIVQVPVCWPAGDVAGRQALISVPLRQGDPVKLSFSERALENWLAGADSAPDDPRQFDLSDAFATPVVRPGAGRADTENVSVQYGRCALKLTPAGDAILGGPGEFRVTMPAVFEKDVSVEGLFTYGAGMAGKGGSAGTRIAGDIHHGGGTIHSDNVVDDGHRHHDSRGGDTSGPLP
ncbi:Gp138 family membrane-puncturing spike protein [Cupriavidus sp. D384]|uniref:Gp138 family membrane-puncturing spike protein n=1 Tax=Cupriavidus sp. D384 TaxID=1538095 RepID=UPI00083113C1|nr:Gp138 family membrane-puncturing spike protein [Cupriavidus sp. D384]